MQLDALVYSRRMGTIESKQRKGSDTMTNLNALTVTNVEYSTDLASGFFWVEFDNGQSLQCCLHANRDADGCYESFNAAIEIDNNGYDYGICYDVNAWAKDEDGELSHVEDFLIEKAREAGLSIVA